MDEFTSTTEIIRQALEEAELKYQTKGDNDEIFVVGFNLDSPLSSVQCYVYETPIGFMVVSSSPIGGNAKDREMMIALTELITRINYSARLVKFTMDMNDGELRCEIDAPCMPETKPTPLFVNVIIHAVTNAWEKYAPSFLAVIFGGKSPEEAHALATQD